MALESLNCDCVDKAVAHQIAKQSGRAIYPTLTILVDRICGIAQDAFGRHIVTWRLFRQIHWPGTLYMYGHYSQEPALANVNSAQSNDGMHAGSEAR